MFGVGVAVAVLFGKVGVGVLVGLDVALAVGICVWVIVTATDGKGDGNDVGISDCVEAWHPIAVRASTIMKISNLHLSNSCGIWHLWPALS